MSEESTTSGLAERWRHAAEAAVTGRNDIDHARAAAEQLAKSRA